MQQKHMQLYTSTKLNSSEIINNPQQYIAHMQVPVNNRPCQVYYEGESLYTDLTIKILLYVLINLLHLHQY